MNRFHIEYEPRATIKGHVLADFIAEFSDITVVEVALLALPTGGQEATTSLSEMEINKQMEQLIINTDEGPDSAWSLHIDGASNRNVASVHLTMSQNMKQLSWA